MLALLPKRFGICFALRDCDNAFRKISQTLEGSSVRRLSFQRRFGFFPLRGRASRRSGGLILPDEMAIGQALSGNGG